MRSARALTEDMALLHRLIYGTLELKEILRKLDGLTQLYVLDIMEGSASADGLGLAVAAGYLLEDLMELVPEERAPYFWATWWEMAKVDVRQVSSPNCAFSPRSIR